MDILWNPTFAYYSDGERLRRTKLQMEYVDERLSPPVHHALV